MTSGDGRHGVARNLKASLAHLVLAGFNPYGVTCVCSYTSYTGYWGHIKSVPVHALSGTALAFFVGKKYLQVVTAVDRPTAVWRGSDCCCGFIRRVRVNPPSALYSFFVGDKLLGIRVGSFLRWHQHHSVRNCKDPLRRYYE